MELNAVLGIFTAYNYSQWRVQYRQDHAFTIPIHDLSEIIVNATDPSDTHHNGSVTTALIYNGTITEGETLDVTFLDNSTLFGTVVNTSGVLSLSASSRPVLDFDPTAWLCNDNATNWCDRAEAKRFDKTWLVSPLGIPIDYCLSERTPQQKCQIRYSSIILGVVIGCDLVKVCIVVLCLRQSDRPLVTLGDVIEYFMEHREQMTRERCLLSHEQIKKEIAHFYVAVGEAFGGRTWARTWAPIDFSTSKTRKKLEWYGLKHKTLQEVFADAPRVVWQPKRLRWYNAVSKRAWISLYTM